jgi:N-acylneuraminate cytidylyltransferase
LVRRVAMDGCVALIPARGGSKRVPGKNVRLLAGHPLLAYTVSAALRSGEFNKVLVSSDDPATLEIAASYGADVLPRPDEFAGDTSPDIGWVSHALNVLGGPSTSSGRRGEVFDTFSILRPTSPFRKPETIQRAFAEWGASHQRGERYSSLRAVEKVNQHPGKMWRIHGKELVPLLLQPGSPTPRPFLSESERTASRGERTFSEEARISSPSFVSGEGVRGWAAFPQPWHDSQYAALPEIYVQNASLEIAWTRTVEHWGAISGPRILPFLTHADEGFDVNTEHDWLLAELMVARGEAVLPKVESSLPAWLRSA